MLSNVFKVCFFEEFMLIGLTGRLACGKGFVADILKELGFDYITVSNIVRKEAARLGIPILRTHISEEII